MLGSVFHHPAFVAQDGWPFSHDDCVGVRDSIVRQHVTAGFNPSPAYNYFPCQHGLIEDGRTFARLSGANGTTHSNLNYWAYCALLPMEHQPSGPLLDALLFLRDTAPGPGREVLPHNRVPGVSTACPNPPLTEWIDAGCPRPILAPAPIPKECDMLIRNAQTGARLAVAGFDVFGYRNLANLPESMFVPLDDDEWIYTVNALADSKTKATAGPPAPTVVSGSVDPAMLRVLIREEIDKTRLSA